MRFCIECKFLREVREQMTTLPVYEVKFQCAAPDLCKPHPITGDLYFADPMIENEGYDCPSWRKK